MLKIILLSDLHLENKSTEASNFILLSINEKIQEVRTQGDEPVVVLAGDVHNGTKGYPWMSNIDAQVLYVAGNHEYWGEDFYEINEKLLEKKPSNVEFLYNKAIILDKTIFLGSCLWTDVAYHTNPDISEHCNFVMNDVLKIKAKKWYKDKKNIEQLTALTSRSDEFIEKNYWNILIERQENEKTNNFYKAFNAIHSFFTQYLDSKKAELKYALNSTYDKLSKFEYDDKMHNLLNFDVSFKKYLENNQNFYKKYGNTGFPLEMLSDNEFLEPLFHQFKKVPLKDMSIVVVSHHLPFMEELLIGRHRKTKNFEHEKNSALFNSVNEKLFLINKGVDYPYYNYFWRSAKGEFKKEEDITKIAHYCNSGSNMFEQSFINKVNVWLHGHEHHYNYIDYLKGIKIATNPIGYALYGVEFKDEKPFNKNILDNDETQYVIDIKKSLTQEVIITNKNESINQIQLWSWYLWNKDVYLDKLNETLYLNKKLSALIAKKMQGQKYDQFQINTYALALNSCLEEIENEQNKLKRALSIRGDVNYSFSKEAFDILESQYISFTMNLRGSRELEKLNISILKEEFEFNFSSENKKMNSYGLRELFFNSVHLSYAQKKVQKVKEILNEFTFDCPQDIPKELIKEFMELNKSISYNEQNSLEEKLNKRLFNYLNKIKVKVFEEHEDKEKYNF